METTTSDTNGRATGRRVLLTGTPGCGKRSLGNLLAVTELFAHVDLDGSRHAAPDAGTLWARLEPSLAEDADVVATWTPSSDDDLPLLELLQASGFEWIWLDCDCGAALHAAFGDLGHLDAPRLVDAFEPDGTFRPLARVLDEILAPQPLVAGGSPRAARPRLQFDPAR